MSCSVQECDQLSRKLTESRQECERLTELYNRVKERVTQLEANLKETTQNEKKVLLTSCSHIKNTDQRTLTGEGLKFLSYMYIYIPCRTTVSTKSSLFIKPTLYVVGFITVAYCQKENTVKNLACSSTNTEVDSPDKLVDS